MRQNLINHKRMIKRSMAIDTLLFMIPINLLLALMIVMWMSISTTNGASKTNNMPRCWVGVIDQINLPWIFVVGEQGEEAYLSLDHAYMEAKEGDWVIYWSKAKRIEPLRSAMTTQASASIQYTLEQLGSRLTDREYLEK